MHNYVIFKSQVMPSQFLRREGLLIIGEDLWQYLHASTQNKRIFPVKDVLPFGILSLDVPYPMQNTLGNKWGNGRRGSGEMEGGD